MAKAPVMPLFTDALLADTMALTTEEFGAYMLLLVVTWRNNGEALPDDDHKLAKICRVSVHKWRLGGLKSRLGTFFRIDETGWHQKRLEKEWQRIETLRNSGKQGGLQKASNKASKTLANGVQPLTINQVEGREPYSSPTPLPDGKPPSRAPAPSAAPPSRGSASAPPARPSRAKPPTPTNGHDPEPPIPLGQARIDITAARERTGNDQTWINRQLRAFVERDPLGDFRRSPAQWQTDWDKFLETRLRTRT